MIDNSENRTHEVFFYGLYMDPEILNIAGVSPNNPRIGYVEDFELKIGNKATLLRATGKKAHGIIYSLTHADINKLYWGSGLTEYAAEALIAKVGNQSLPVLSCNLIVPPKDSESNLSYEEKLMACMAKLGVECELA